MDIITIFFKIIENVITHEITSTYQQITY